MIFYIDFFVSTIIRNFDIIKILKNMITSKDLQHTFPQRAHDLVALFNNTNKMSTFMNKLEKQSLKDPDRYDPDKYKGDAFEYFVEIFLKTHSCDNRVGITDYTPVQSEDNGVDGTGINLSGVRCAVQVKYRGNTQSFLTANKDHLSNLVTDAHLKFGIVKTEKTSDVPNYYVITTANGLHHYTDNEFFRGYVKCIGFDDLRAFLDGNLSFWNLCREISKQY